MIDYNLIKEYFIYDLKTGIFKWKIKPHHKINIGDVAGCKIKDGYISIQINNKKYKAHRLAWLYVYGEMPKLCIDHINGIRHDNRIENLRDVSRKINSQNIKKIPRNNTSGLLGAYWHKNRNKWVSQIAINGKDKHLGLFETPQLAHEAYLKAKREFHEGCTI